MLDLILIWVHVLANLVWIGAIVATGVILSLDVGEPKARGEIALAIYKRLAVPGFVLSFVFGVARLAKDTGYYLKQHHWMHGKLLFAVAVIGLHHVIGGKAKKVARGDEKGAGMALPLGLLACAAIAAFFAVIKD
jgi:putative membrane protein